MNSGSRFPDNAQDRRRKAAGHAAGRDLPAPVRESAAVTRGVYDARRLRSQRDVIRDVMLAAADCDTWLTLTELRSLTRYGEASISAQLRHLRKSINGGYEVIKRRREEASPGQAGECMWEYRIDKFPAAPLGGEEQKLLQSCGA